MVVIYRNSYPPISSEILDQLEIELGLPLPVEYRRFLLLHNGGRPAPNVFQTKNGSLEMVDWFLGLHEGEHDSLRKYVNCYKSRLPSGLLPIAHDAGGNLICISVSTENKGWIYFWDHEKEALERETPTYDNITLVAESLKDFLLMLRNLEDFTHP